MPTRNARRRSASAAGATAVSASGVSAARSRKPALARIAETQALEEGGTEQADGRDTHPQALRCRRAACLRLRVERDVDVVVPKVSRPTVADTARRICSDETSGDEILLLVDRTQPRHL